jgi:hypothetical protein
MCGEKLLHISNFSILKYAHTEWLVIQLLVSLGSANNFFRLLRDSSNFFFAKRGPQCFYKSTRVP